MDNKESKGGLNKSLKLIFVYTVATGSIFTFVTIGTLYSMVIVEAGHSSHSHL